MLSDPWFYLAAFPAVVLFGLSKGGFSGISLLSMPLMALVVSPVQAAAIALPVLMAQDVVTLWSFRRSFDATILRHTIPGAMLGILLGWLTAAWVTPDMVRLAVGLIAIAFVLHAVFGARRLVRTEVPPPSVPSATVWGALAGYASFVVHAGGPPWQIYVVPRAPTKEFYAGTTGVFFAIVNLVKLPPYIALGQMTREALLMSAALIPLAVVSNMLGIWLVRRIQPVLFYKTIYALTFVVGAKLVLDGVRALTGV